MFCQPLSVTMSFAGSASRIGRKSELMAKTVMRKDVFFERMTFVLLVSKAKVSKRLYQPEVGRSADAMFIQIAKTKHIELPSLCQENVKVSSLEVFSRWAVQVPVRNYFLDPRVSLGRRP